MSETENKELEPTFETQQGDTSDENQNEGIKSKADWLQELEDAGIVEDSLEWDNLKIVQIEHLINTFKDRNSNEEEVVKRRESEQKYNALKQKISKGISQLQETLK